MTEPSVAHDPCDIHQALRFIETSSLLEQIASAAEACLRGEETLHIESGFAVALLLIAEDTTRAARAAGVRALEARHLAPPTAAATDLRTTP